MRSPQLQEDDILYEDNHLLVVNKKAGWPVQGDASGDESVVEMSKAFLKEKYGKPGNVFAGLVHRIDRPVSGLVLIAKTSKALSRMTKSFQSREVEKYYLAVTLGKTPVERGFLEDELLKDRSRNQVRVLSAPRPGSKSARLDYELLAESGGHYLMGIRPLTGRSHQIRVQLAHAGAVIAGDLKYGAPAPLPDKSIALHARSLAFIHPVKKEPLKITAPLPPISIWSKFENQIS